MGLLNGRSPVVTTAYHRSAAAARAAELQEELERLEDAHAQAVKDGEASHWAFLKPWWSEKRKNPAPKNGISAWEMGSEWDFFSIKTWILMGFHMI